jgi:hypothetical protein
MPGAFFARLSLLGHIIVHNIPILHQQLDECWLYTDIRLLNELTWLGSFLFADGLLGAWLDPELFFVSVQGGSLLDVVRLRNVVFAQSLLSVGEGARVRALVRALTPVEVRRQVLLKVLLLSYVVGEAHFSWLPVLVRGLTPLQLVVGLVRVASLLRNALVDGFWLRLGVCAGLVVRGDNSFLLQFNLL